MEATAEARAIRAYFAALPPDARRGLKNIRAAIRSAAPAAVDSFGYGFPAFKVNGKGLVWYAAWKEHYSLYPVGSAFLRAHASDVEGYSTAKGTIRLPMTEPLPLGLVKRLVKARLAQLREEKANRP